MLKLFKEIWGKCINIRQRRFQTNLLGKKGKLIDKKVTSLGGYDNLTYLCN